MLAQQERNGAIVDQGNLHVRAETSARHTAHALPHPLHEYIEQSARMIRWRSRSEAWTSAPSRVCCQCELRHYKHFAVDFDNTAIHRLRRIRKDPEIQGSIGELLRHRRRVLWKHSYEHQ